MIFVTNYNSSTMASNAIMYEAILSLQTIRETDCVLSIYNPIQFDDYYGFINELIRNNPQTNFYVTNWILDSSNILISDNKQITAYNKMLEDIEYKNYTIIDLNQISARYGRDNIVSNKFWYSHNCPFTKFGKEKIIEVVGNAIAVNYGEGIKAIVVDGDNTLWKGVILEGTAELTVEYEHLHKVLKKYRDTGIFLAICSKNNEEDVWKFLSEHDSLQKEHFSAYQINFDKKSDNIMKIAEALNISPRNILFVDDMAYEIFSVKNECNTYTLRSVPSENLANSILTHPLLNHTYLTAEDTSRVEAYEYVKKNEENPEFTITKTPNDARRISQMSNKTNQFNLNKSPLTAEQVTRLIKDKKLFTCELYYCKMMFGTVAYAVLEGDTIEQFVVSCRVFGMRVEDKLLDALKQNGATKGIIKKTDKNKLFHNFYSDNGIEEV